MVPFSNRLHGMNIVCHGVTLGLQFSSYMKTRGKVLMIITIEFISLSDMINGDENVFED